MCMQGLSVISGIVLLLLSESRSSLSLFMLDRFSRALAAKLILPTQFLPILVKMGPTWIRRKIIDYLPFEAVQGMNKLINVMWETSCRIYDNKKESIRAGDETIIQKQIGQGKDVISALCKFYLGIWCLSIGFILNSLLVSQIQRSGARRR